jgi:hypothetical protein
VELSTLTNLLAAFGGARAPGFVRRRLCTRVPAISRQINFWNGEELMRRDTVTAVQQGAALQQREKFHG